MTSMDIAHMIAQIGKVPSLQTQAITQEIFDALHERLDSLERQVRALQLHSRPFKSFAGMKPSGLSPAPKHTLKKTADAEERSLHRRDVPLLERVGLALAGKRTSFTDQEILLVQKFNPSFTHG